MRVSLANQVWAFANRASCLDLITVKYMLDYYTSPMKLFGRIGLAHHAAGIISLSCVLG